MLLLAHAESLIKHMTIGAAMRPVFDAESFQAGERGDMAEYSLVGSDAIIPVCGPISYKYDFWSWYMGGCSYQGITAKIRAAQSNQDVKRIVMVFDTPGGEVTGCRTAAKVIRESAKPCVAMVDPMCASAGLWLASQCKKITIAENAVEAIGSLGVQITLQSYARMFEEAGIDTAIIRAAISPSKNLGHPREPMSDEAKEHFQKMADKYGEMFLADVAEGRKVSREIALEKFGKGQMLDSEMALEVGLVDAIGTLESVMAEREPSTKRASNHRVSLNTHLYMR